MRYMLLIYAEEQAQDPGPEAGVTPPWLEFGDWLKERNYLVGGDRLAPSTSATTVRVQESRRLVTDGPFAETKEVLGGYYLLECPDLDAALEAAARCPGASYGSVEVRPLVSMTPTSADTRASTAT